MAGGHSHKAGALKQSNKQHKGLNSKRALKRSFGPGKVEARKSTGTGKKLPTKGNDGVDARAKRMDRNQQIKKKKNADVLQQKRLGSANGPPKIIGVVCLSRLANEDDALEMVRSEGSWSSSSSAEGAGGSVMHVVYAKHKARCTFMTAKCENIEAVLEVGRVADVIVFVVCASSGGSLSEQFIDASGFTAVSALKAAGCPEVLCCAQNFDLLTGKTLLDTRKALTKQLDDCIGPDVRVGESHKADLFCRLLCTVTPRTVTWRATRSYLLGDTVEVSQTGGGDNGEEPCVTISGYMRGRSMALNSLMHLPGLGTGRINRVEAGKTHFPGGRRALTPMDDDADSTLVAEKEKQDSLVLEADSTGLAGEQTWPTEEEMNAALDGIDEGAGRHRRDIKTGALPKGMSSYQADWFVDEQGDFDSKVAAPEGEAAANDMEEGEEGEEDDDMTFGGSMLDAPFLGGTGHIEKQKLRALADSDAQFPDEMDTPVDVKARERFARYRALQSFRASPWHPKENLPVDYSRIYQFENFAGVQRRSGQYAQDVDAAVQAGEVEEDEAHSFAFTMPQAVEGPDDEMAPESDEDNEVFLRSGHYISIVIDGLTAFALEGLSQRKSVTAFGLQPHENRLSVLHFSIKRHPGYAETIKSKETLIFQTGFRAFECKPIFSESNLNCDKHKMERYLSEGKFSMASVYGPISFMPCPLLVFKRLENGQTILVATGSLAKVDPDRIMLKKVVLTGLPLRVRSRHAVVKHLFYDVNDVRWFKPAELVTKHGLRGHIKEPVGTHGLLKALFSAPIAQNDTIMLILYKRVYPKFAESNQVVVL